MKLEKKRLSISCPLFFLLFWVMLSGVNPAAGADKSVCETGCDHDTIQAAVDDAFSGGGGTVTVQDSRTYDECVTMKNGVHLQSAFGQTPTISCTGPGVASVTIGGGAISSNVDGFNITHSANSGAGIILDGTLETVTAVISNCNVYDIAASAGIRMNGVVQATITGNTIYDSTSGISVGQPGVPGDEVSSTSSITIKGNTIGAASPNNNQFAGIYLKGTGNVTAAIGGAGDEANTIHHNAQAGIRVETITDLIIDNNTIDNNTKAGLLLIDVGTPGDNAVVQNNTIINNKKAGINIGGASYLTVGSNNIISNNATGGIAFNMGDVEVFPGTPASGSVTISGNDHINSNTYGGILVKDAISTVNTVHITQNDIYSNEAGGIGVQNACKLEIAENTVRDNVLGGIKTGDDSLDPGGFLGRFGSADLTIKKNKIHGNGQSGFGGGIDVRHADGTIYNNLVYENHRGGIRFGDWIDEIVNNTVSDNGNDNGTPDDHSDDRGGGIIYDDISFGDGVNDPPEGALPNPNVLIRNNVLAYNATAGLRVGNMPSGLTSCPDNPVLDDPTPGDKYRDYNLLYANNGILADNSHCSWDDTYPGRRCVNRNYGQCGFVCEEWPSNPDCWNASSENDILADPAFVDRAADNYQLQAGSPAENAGDDGTELGAYGGADPIAW